MRGLVRRQEEEKDGSVSRPKKRAKNTGVRGVDKVLE